MRAACRRPFWLAPALLSAMAPAQAHDPAAEARRCAVIDDEARRLACYDALFRSSAEPAVAAAAPAGNIEEFGLSGQQREERKRQAGEPVAPDQITSRVLRVTPRKPNPPVLELENGQHWRLLESSDFPQFKVGDTVTIRRGAMGSYLASAAGGRGVWRVRRVDAEATPSPAP